MINQAKECRHEFVIMFQRRWTPQGKRLTGRRAYLPVGFKTTDLGYLSDGAYCFCVKCRLRLHPQLTRAQRQAARLAKKAQKLAADLERLEPTEPIKPVEVEELELEDTSVELMPQTGLRPPNIEEDEEEESQEY